MAGSTAIGKFPRMLDHGWAAALPSLAGLVLLILIVVAHISAVSTGKSDRDVDGHKETVFMPEISFTTAESPESWLWSIGVVVVWVSLLLPTFKSVHEVFTASPPPSLFLLLALVCFILGSLALVCLAVVTRNETAFELNMPNGKAIHQVAADVFFVLSFLHGVIVVVHQWCKPRVDRVVPRHSLLLKTALLIFIVLCLSQAVPLLLMALCPEDLCSSHTKVRTWNQQGFTQRLVVLGIIGFMSSYSLDILKLQRQLQPQEVRSTSQSGGRQRQAENVS